MKAELTQAVFVFDINKTTYTARWIKITDPKFFYKITIALDSVPIGHYLSRRPITKTASLELIKKAIK